MKGILKRIELVAELERGLQEERVVVLVSKPRLGKSITLLQLSESLQKQSKKLLSLNVMSDESKVDLVGRLTNLIVGPSSGAKTLGELVEIWNQNECIVALDQFENLTDGDDLLQYFSEHLTKGSLIVASRRLPRLSPLVLAGLKICRLQPLDQTECQNLISLFLSKPEPVLLEHSSGILKGRPEQIRFVCGMIKVAETTPTEEQILNFCKDSLRDSQFKLFLRLSQNLQIKLLAASLVEIDKQLVVDIMKSLNPTERSELQNLAWLSENSHELFFDLTELKDQLEIPVELILGAKEFLLEVVKSSERQMSKMEEARILKENGKLVDAAKVFNENLEPIASRLDSQTILNLTDDLQEWLSGFSWYRRSMAHRIMGKTQESIEELEKVEIEKFSEREKRYLNYSIFRNVNFIQKVSFDESLKKFQTLCEPDQPRDEVWYRSYLKTLTLHNNLGRDQMFPKEARIATSEVVNNPTFDDELRIDMLQQCAVFFERLGDSRDAEIYYSKAFEIACRGSSAFNIYWIKIALLDVQFLRSPSDKIRHEVQLIAEEVQKLDLPYLITESIEKLIYFDTALGRPKSAIEAYSDRFSSVDLQGSLNRMSLLNAFVANNNIHETRKILERFAPFKSFGEYWHRLRCDLIEDVVINLEMDDFSFWRKYSTLDLTDWQKSLLRSTLYRTAWFSYFYGIPKDFPFNPEASSSDEPLRRAADYACAGWLNLTREKLGLAKEYFEIGLEIADRTGLHLQFHRASSGLAVLDIKDGEFELALSRLRVAAARESKMDPLSELELNHLLSAYCLLKLGNKLDAKTQIDLTNLGGRFDYLRYLVCQELDLNEYPTKPAVPEMQKQFCEKIARTLGLQLIRRTEIRDESGRVLFGEEGKTLLKNKDFVWDLIKGEIACGTQKTPIRDKRQIQELLYFLCCHPKEVFTKEQLIGFVWKESYNPLVHDSRVYTAVKRLRELLSEYFSKDPIIQESGKYGLNGEIKFAVIAVEQNSLNINDRQKWILDFADQNGEINRQTAEKVLQSSPAQIKRDLKELVDRGLLTVEGAARSTRYIRGLGTKTKVSSSG